MMAGVIVYNAADQVAKIIGGTAFYYIVVAGELGCRSSGSMKANFQRKENSGHIVQHALSLYTQLIEFNSNTSKFIQALALLEYLADPRDYVKFEKVKKVIARYVARERRRS